MPTVNIHEAKAKLSSLIRKVLAGQEVVIARRNVPLVKLVAVDSARRERTLGWAGGRIELASDFDETPADFEEYV